MNLRKRIVLRAYLRRMSRTQPNVRELLHSEDMFELFSSDLMFEQSIEDPSVQDLQSFLDWLIANQDAILALIQKIISLFAGLNDG